MWTRTDAEGTAVRNPAAAHYSAACYNWSPHDCRVVGDCYRFTAPGCEVNVFSRVGLSVDLPTEDDIERWGTFLQIQEAKNG